MNPLEALIEEHRQIRVVISAITALMKLTRGERQISPAPFLELQRFIARFADGSHHAKEEQVLFEQMIKAGIPAEGGPIDCMLNEHADGRKYAAVMGAAARACLAGDWGQQNQMLEAARSWCVLLSAHTDKEDLMLYPIAQRVIGAERFEQLPSMFLLVDPQPAYIFREAALGVVEAAEEAAHHQRPTG